MIRFQLVASSHSAQLWAASLLTQGVFCQPYTDAVSFHSTQLRLVCSTIQHIFTKHQCIHPCLLSRESHHPLYTLKNALLLLFHISICYRPANFWSHISLQYWVFLFLDLHNSFTLLLVPIIYSIYCHVTDTLYQQSSHRGFISCSWNEAFSLHPFHKSYYILHIALSCNLPPLTPLSIYYMYNRTCKASQQGIFSEETHL